MSMKKFFGFIALAAISLSAFAQEDCTEVPLSLEGKASVRLTRYAHKIIPGVFSVADGKYVLFSQGNLQYNAVLGTHLCADGSTKPGTWRFAENQWDAILGDNTNIAESYDGWIDLFGWGTSGYDDGESTAFQPWESSTTSADYRSSSTTQLDEYTDWARYNTIINGGVNGAPAPGVWSTLTHTEWIYLISGRPNASSLLCYGTLNAHPGVFFFPDTWSETAEVTITAQSGSEVTQTLIEFRTDAVAWSWDTYDNYKDVDHNVISMTTDAEKDFWAALEASGVVFLPMTGSRNGKGVSYTTDRWFYWSTTATAADAADSKARRPYMRPGDPMNVTALNRHNGFAVRPVYRLN